MGLVCAKNASKKFSRLGTFNKTVVSLRDVVEQPVQQNISSFYWTCRACFIITLFVTNAIETLIEK